MSKDLEILKADVKKLMLKDWTKTEVEKLSEFMEDVIVATMVVNKLPIHVVVGQSEQLNCVLCESIKEAKEVINFPLQCGSCGYTHTI